MDRTLDAEDARLPAEDPEGQCAYSTLSGVLPRRFSGIALSVLSSHWSAASQLTCQVRSTAVLVVMMPVGKFRPNSSENV
jgi:hypothetical protein